MSIMTERKKKADSAGKGKRKPKRKGKPLHVWLEPALRDAIDESADLHRRKITEEVSIALEKYLETLGLWPRGNSLAQE